MDTPIWALELTKQVCKDYKRWPPKLEWLPNRHKSSWELVSDTGTEVTYRKKDSTYSSGTTYTRQGMIRMRVGTNEQDVKLVLLHELAHHVLGKTRKGKREHHSIRFWRLAFEMYERYGVDMDYAYDREKGYKVKATQAYQELMQKRNPKPHTT